MWVLALRKTYNDNFYSYMVVLYLVSFFVAWFTLCSCLWDVGTFLIKTCVIWRTWKLCSWEDIGDCRIGVWRFLLAISTILRRTCWSAIGHQMVRKWHQGVQIVWCTSGTQHQEESCTRYSLWTLTWSVTNAALRHRGLKPHLNVQIMPIFWCRFFCKGFVHLVHSYFGFEVTRLGSIWEGLHKNWTLLLS